ncbi:unnamed protein product [Moneuplotes crassus]|uniref:Uncharacterized protein n=1 Tax=Euplotes crassus TaxID=5936 RepID=A0AAD1XAI2_EUPCR|nr:unnamed protein product [Moneuplotes crassus]
MIDTSKDLTFSNSPAPDKKILLVQNSLVSSEPVCVVRIKDGDTISVIFDQIFNRTVDIDDLYIITEDCTIVTDPDTLDNRQKVILISAEKLAELRKKNHKVEVWPKKEERRGRPRKYPPADPLEAEKWFQSRGIKPPPEVQKKIDSLKNKKGLEDSDDSEEGNGLFDNFDAHTMAKARPEESKVGSNHLEEDLDSLFNMGNILNSETAEMMGKKVGLSTLDANHDISVKQEKLGETEDAKKIFEGIKIEGESESLNDPLAKEIWAPNVPISTSNIRDKFREENHKIFSKINARLKATPMAYEDFVLQTKGPKFKLPICNKEYRGLSEDYELIPDYMGSFASALCCAFDIQDFDKISIIKRDFQKILNSAFESWVKLKALAIPTQTKERFCRNWHNEKEFLKDICRKHEITKETLLQNIQTYMINQQVDISISRVKSEEYRTISVKMRYILDGLASRIDRNNFRTKYEHFTISLVKQHQKVCAIFNKPSGKLFRFYKLCKTSKCPLRHTMLNATQESIKQHHDGLILDGVEHNSVQIARFNLPRIGNKDRDLRSCLDPNLVINLDANASEVDASEVDASEEDK